MASVRQYVYGYVLTYIHKYVSTYLLPRDCAWMTAQNHDTEADVIVGAATIYFNDDLDEATTKEELDSLVTATNKNDIDLTISDIIERLENRDNSEESPISYSWVNLNESRLFEPHERCLAWSTSDNLRDVVADIP